MHPHQSCLRPLSVLTTHQLTHLWGAALLLRKDKATAQVSVIPPPRHRSLHVRKHPELEQAPGQLEQAPGQGSLACCSPWGSRSRTQLSDWAELKHPEIPPTSLWRGIEEYSLEYRGGKEDWGGFQGQHPTPVFPGKVRTRWCWWMPVCDAPLPTKPHGEALLPHCPSTDEDPGPTAFLRPRAASLNPAVWVRPTPGLRPLSPRGSALKLPRFGLDVWTEIIHKNTVIS